MTNLFLAGAIALSVHFAVESSFISIGDYNSLDIQKDNIIELERVYLEKMKLNSQIEKTHEKIDIVSEVKAAVSLDETTPEASVTELKPAKSIEFRKPVLSKRSLKLATKKVVFEKPTKTVSKPKLRKKVAAIKLKAPKAPVVERVVDVKAGNELELSYREIKSQKRITITKVNHIAWTKLDLKLKDYGNTAVAETNNQIDRISTAQSAPETSYDNNKDITALNSKPEVNLKEESSDLVFFDYGSKNTNNESSEFQNESPSKKPSKKLAMLGALTTQKSKQKTPDPIIEKIKKEFERPNKAKGRSVAKVDPAPAPLPGPNPFIKTDSPDCYSRGDLSQNETFRAEYSLSLLEVDYGSKNGEAVNNWELQFHDDTNIYKEDFGNGVIKLDFKMNSQISIRRGTVLARGYYPTSLDLVFEPGEVKANIPMFTLKTFNKVLNENSLRGLGAHALVELDDSTEDVEIDISKKYEAKLYLDKDFNVVSRQDSAYNYVLFVGVDAGNAIFNFKRTDRKVINKLAYLAADQIFYEPNFYAEIKSDNFSLYREALIGNCKSMINFSPNNIKPWNYEGTVKKETTNTAKISNMIYPVGSRKYVEVKYDDLKESIFVGRWGHENVILPTEEYIAHVMGEFRGQARATSCMIQLNLTKQVKNIAFNGQSKDHGMNLQIKVLDGDGIFYQDFSDRSERAFLLGQEEGTVNIAIDYIDGSSQYLQSFCSDATYIVEQL